MHGNQLQSLYPIKPTEIGNWIHLCGGIKFTTQQNGSSSFDDVAVHSILFGAHLVISFGPENVHRTFI